MLTEAYCCIPFFGTVLKQNYFNYALVQLIWELVCPLNIVVMELQMCGAEVNVNEEMSWNFESLIA